MCYLKSTHPGNGRMTDIRGQRTAVGGQKSGIGELESEAGKTFQMHLPISKLEV